MDDKTLIPKLALALIPGVGASLARALFTRCSSADEIFRLNRRDLTSIPGIGNLIADKILKTDTFRRAEEEVQYIKKEQLRVRFLFDDDYPPLLLQCQDAPLVIFSRGNLEEQGHRFLSIVGTRNPSSRGLQITREIIFGLSEQDPSIVIISGLAYGIDIQAHLAALDSGLKTIAVLGHGFHTLYPAVHRGTAERIIRQGCLVSDFFSYNLPEPKNFIKRNRIIAGWSEATLVIESGAKGGAMVTAEMANSYDRDVFALPGRPDDSMSRGCNFLIRNNLAILVESAGDLIASLGWQQGPRSRQPVQQELFENLNPEDQALFRIMTDEPQTIDQLSRLAGLPVQMISAQLLSLEFKGLIKCLPGQQYTR
jgi:DNA processing protein